MNHSNSLAGQSIGIDFGTSNSTVGFMREEKSTLVPFENAQTNTPSAIFFDFEENSVFYGRAAIARHTDGHSGRLMRSMKSVLGSSLMDERTRIGQNLVPFTDIIGLFISHLKQTTETHLGKSVDRVVLGRPVFFVDGDVEADRAAADVLKAVVQDQGITEVTFQYEPIAAALEYESTCTKEELALVVDIGGGTADFSIIRVSRERASRTDRDSDVLANYGIHVGGTDFDRVLSLKSVMPHLGYRSEIGGIFDENRTRIIPNHYYVELATWHKIYQQYDPKNLNSVRELIRTARDRKKPERLLDVLERRQGHELAARVESAKIALSGQTSFEIELQFGSQQDGFSVTRRDFEDSIQSLVAGLKTAVEDTITQAGIDRTDLDTVFLTGGTTAVPLVRDTLAEMFPHSRFIEGDRFGSVGAGLALEAARRYGA